jgi:hypothetical protein
LVVLPVCALFQGRIVSGYLVSNPLLPLGHLTIGLTSSAVAVGTESAMFIALQRNCYVAVVVVVV